jgi:hypothetical protein
MNFAWFSKLFHSDWRFTSGRRSTWPTCLTPTIFIRPKRGTHPVDDPFFDSNRRIRPKGRDTSGTRPITWLFSWQENSKLVHVWPTSLILVSKTVPVRYTSSLGSFNLWFSSTRRPHFSRVPDVDQLHPHICSGCVLANWYLNTTGTAFFRETKISAGLSKNFDQWLLKWLILLRFSLK